MSAVQLTGLLLVVAAVSFCLGHAAGYWRRGRLAPRYRREER